MRLGVHVSIADSIDQAVDRAKEEGCEAFQIFTRNPRGWKFADLDPDEVKSFKGKLAQSNLGPVVDHMPYLPNLSSPADELYEKSTATLAAEVDRCGTLGIPYLVIHLGSHLGMGRDVGLQRLTDALNMAVKRVKKDPWILLENMAGQKNSMGSNFRDVGEIIEGVKKRERLGVCLDTCHAYAAGMDLHTEKGVDQTFANFDEEIGFDKLKVVHLNDSEGGQGSGLDRHEHIGMGYIGAKGFKAILNQKQIRDLPWILETPEDERRDDKDNLEMVRKLAK
ncbi:MAG TPA: deoxyribonuclease IV [Candidatus Bathyarchaeia archaeon]|nr:deoxyribonuclease IV [Candidatus Bathyarchaeia archaeon]